MKHNYFGKKLNRDVKERRALFKNLIKSLIEKEKIKTTVTKAFSVKNIIEKMISLAKKNTASANRLLASLVSDKKNIDKVKKDLSLRFSKKTGGFIRIRKVGKRSGDNSEEAVIEWTVIPEVKEKKSAEKIKPEKSLIKEKKPKEEKK